MNGKGEVRALNQVTRELRDAAPPDLDFDRMGARLDGAIPAPRWGAPPVASRRGVVMPLLGVAAAAAMLAAWAQSPSVAPLASVGTVWSLERSVDASTLAPGARLASGAHRITVRHAGVATWELAPGSVARWASSTPLTIALDSGQISARVVPSPQPESFAVEAGSTRVAVHGTAFVVRHVAGRVEVNVTEGVVVVGPHGQAPRFSLPAPASGVFDLQGEGAGPLGGGAARIAAVVASSAAPSVAAPVKLDRLSSAPSREAITALESSVRRALQQCFVASFPADGDMHVSVSTRLTLAIAPSGELGSPSFEPPLAPAVRQCALESLRSLAGPASHEGGRVETRLELSR